MKRKLMVVIVMIIGLLLTGIDYLPIKALAIIAVIGWAIALPWMLKDIRQVRRSNSQRKYYS